MVSTEGSISKRLRDQRLYGPAVKARRVDPVGSFGASVGPDNREISVLAFAGELIDTGVASGLTPRLDPCSSRVSWPRPTGSAATRNHAPSSARSRLRVC